MGVLTSKCIYTAPFNMSARDEIIKTEEFSIHANDIRNQYISHGRDEPKLCRSNANLCPPNYTYTCLTGFGGNPNYGYTNFDTFGWSLLSTFRLITQDFWEDLYQMVVITAGPWHTVFFALILFLGSFYLLSLMVATVVMSYDEVQKKIEANKSAEAAMEMAAESDVEGEHHIEGNRNFDAKDGEKGLKSGCLKCIDFCCVWDCACWTYVQKFCSLIIFDPFVELFIILCIVANILCMAMDHHDMTVEFYYFLYSVSPFFLLIYVIETLMKIIAMNPKFYFQDGWNIFEFLIVMIALLELSLEGIQGILLFRLLSVFRLVKFWPSLNSLIYSMGQTVGALAKLSFVLLFIVSIFAVLGMQLSGSNYLKYHYLFYGEMVPRYNFTDFMHSFMVVFRALCGEWIETMWDCMVVSGWPCIPFYIAIVVIGNFVLLNIYLALLLGSLNASNSSRASEWGNNKRIVGAYKRMSMAKNLVKTKLFGPQQENGIFGDKVHPEMEGYNLSIEKPSKEPASSEDLGEDKLAVIVPGTEAGVNRDKLESTAIDISAGSPADSCPKTVRGKIVESTYFQIIVITIVIVSSLALAAEDVNLKYRPTLRSVLSHMDKVFAILFLLEMLIKCIGLGFRKYFTNAWCWLEFIVTLASMFNLIVSLGGYGIITVFKTMRVLRALWLLKVLSRFQGMQLVLNTLVQAIPALCNAALLSWIFWLLFAIVGVQLFGGKFYFCTEYGDEKFNISNINDRDECQVKNLTWANPMINFDNVLNAHLALFQVATFKGWIDIIFNAVDTRQLDEQPEEEANLYMYLYFVCFIIVCSFFTLALFTAVIFKSFHEQKKKAGGSMNMVMTEDQKLYYTALKKAGDKKPVKAIQGALYDFTSNRKFDMVMMMFLGLFFVTLAFDHYQLQETFNVVLEYLHLFFVVIFTLECVLKISAFRFYYFKDPWNVYDFVVVILLILGVVLKDVIAKYFVSPTLLLMLRILRVGRVLRPFKGARRFRALFHALDMSLPAMFSICILLFLLSFVYAIFGMSFFMNVKHRYFVDENFNFETFGQAMLVLFQIFTGAGWDGVLAATMDESDCYLPDPEFDDPGNCGSMVLGIAYLVSYVTFTFLIINKMFIAVIIENYMQALQDAQEGLTTDDYDMFYETWRRFVPEGTRFIQYDSLTDFLDALEEPLRISKPNKHKIISMDIPICEGDLICCVDILDAVTKDFFARKGHDIEEAAGISDALLNKDRGGFQVVNSTLSIHPVEPKNSWR